MYTFLIALLRLLVSTRYTDLVWKAQGRPYITSGTRRFKREVGRSFQQAKVSRGKENRLPISQPRSPAAGPQLGLQGLSWLLGCLNSLVKL